MAEAALTFRNLEQFLAWERAQSERWEWYGGAPVAMTGTTVAHNLICGSLRDALRQALRPRGCRAFTESVKVVVAGTLLYPDVVVTCGQIGDREDIAREPILIAEVLSPSSSSYDRNAKRALYRLIPTLEHYLVVSQTRAMVEVDSRVDQGWSTAHVIGANAAVELPRLGVVIPMAAIYEDTELARDAS
jgi:Uma2 family endonuclease